MNLPKLFVCGAAIFLTLSSDVSAQTRPTRPTNSAEPATQSATQKIADSPRRYAQGPLQVREFTGRAKRYTGRQAMTMTRVMFEYKFQTNSQRDGTFATTLTRLQTYAVFLPKESWWTTGNNPDLLDHEQGHFDIAEITARRIQGAFDKVLKGGGDVTATGNSQQQSEQALLANIRKVIRVAEQQADHDHLEYDQVTSHGLRYAKQSEVRRIQKLTLAKLADHRYMTRKSSGRDE